MVSPPSLMNPLPAGGSSTPVALSPKRHKYLAAIALTLCLPCGASTVTVSDGGVLSGDGVINAPVVVNSGGVLRPGTGGPGCLTMDGLTMTSGSSLDIEVNGLTACDQHDAVVVTDGALSVSGATLAVSSSGYSPSLSDIVVFLSNESGTTTTASFDGVANGDTVQVGGVALTFLESVTNSNDAGLKYLTTPSKPLVTNYDESYEELVVYFAVENIGASAITEYSVSCTGSSGTVLGSSNTSPISLTGITEDETYQCTVTATNAQGDSFTSDAVELTAVDLKGLPIWLLYEASKP